MGSFTNQANKTSTYLQEAELERQRVDSTIASLNYGVVRFKDAQLPSK